jgi:hypothetical protein
VIEPERPHSRSESWGKSTDQFVFDSQMGNADDAEPCTGLGGDSIVVHKK